MHTVNDGNENTIVNELQHCYLSSYKRQFVHIRNEHPPYRKKASIDTHKTARMYVANGRGNHSLRVMLEGFNFQEFNSATILTSDFQLNPFSAR